MGHRLTHRAIRHIFVLLFGTGHLMPSEADESHEGIEVVLEQCRAQNRQLISEMRKPMSVLTVLCTPMKLYTIFVYHGCCYICFNMQLSNVIDPRQSLAVFSTLLGT